jgi:glycosyltransferase involved in cell wall biosynthesis
MRLLILAQKVDKADPVLGFFHGWLEGFSSKFESVIVVCLEKGDYALPNNVKVLSLGKEMGISTCKYIKNFYKYIWQERKNYDSVFVHMNQEYVLLGGFVWKSLNKKVYLWRNHAKGDWLTNMAAFLSNKIFYTSSASYTARFKKAIKMPAGIDTEFFKPDGSVEKQPKSILFLGRISPVKRALEFVDWLDTQDFSYATIAGEALPKDMAYRQLLQDRITEHGLGDRVRFVGAVRQEEALRLYQSHERYVNMTLAGSLDKTILEAASCGTLVKVENPDLKLLEAMDGARLRSYVELEHSLIKLVNALAEELNR